MTVAKQEKEDRTGWPVDERLKARIIDGDREGLTADLDQAMAEGVAPLSIINDILLSGMKVVGELFGSGQMQLPFVLQSAETMKASVAHLEPHMEKVEGDSGKGRIVLATVKGDVHDIGKNLVDIILTNNGYKVHNLGIKIGIAEMIEKAQEVRADAIGMSGLLVKSTLIMRENLEELNTRELADIPVLLGGAALTRSYVERDLRDLYGGRLFYGKDAFEGLHVMDRLGAIKRGVEDDDPEWGRVPSDSRVPSRASLGLAEKGDGPPRRAARPVARRRHRQRHLRPAVPGLAGGQGPAHRRDRRLPQRDGPVPQPVGVPARGGRARATTSSRPASGPPCATSWPRPRPTGCSSRRWSTATSRSTATATTSWCGPTRPARAERARFSYPRQTKAPYYCIADFFRPVDGPEVDYAAFSIVTMGPAISERTAKLFADDRYQEYLLLHGLGVEMAEALAEYWHRRMREEWGFAHEDGPSLAGLFRQQYRGGRYSWGYPACPDLEDNMTVLSLLEGERIGLECNEETGFQYQPEQSTSALVCHHPQAKYFVAR